MKQPRRRSLDEVIAAYRSAPHMAHMGIEIVDAKDGVSTMRLLHRPEIVGAGGILHGGAISWLFDTVGALASWSAFDFVNEEGSRAFTVSLTVEYLSAAKEEHVLGTARVLKRGKGLAFCDIDAIGETSKKHLAKALAVYRIV